MTSRLPYLFQEDEAPIFGTTGFYHGNVVFIRRYKIKNFDLHSKDVQEMRQACILFKLFHRRTGGHRHFYQKNKDTKTEMSGIWE